MGGMCSAAVTIAFVRGNGGFPPLLLLLLLLPRPHFQRQQSETLSTCKSE